MDRVAALTEILAANPTDPFARYALAMELAGQGDLPRALEEFATLLGHSPDYTAGYFMAAQTLVKASRSEDAKRMLENGLASAMRTRNSHAQAEMQAMLDELS
jgi:predicted Zn-dependent protease